MMVWIGSLFLALGAQGASAEWQVTWEAPGHCVQGSAFVVRVEVRGAARAEVPAWLLGPGAFRLDDEAIAERPEGSIPVEPGMTLTSEFDLGPYLSAAVKAPETHVLYLDVPASDARDVVFLPPRGDWDFLGMPAEELAGFHVYLATNRGNMVAELWPDVAPQHVANFLDLANSGFYDGSTFHRVIPNFMIQGGKSASEKEAPRKLDAEFSDREHVPGVLSMARRPDDVDSATSEFFIVHAASPHLDGSYSAFGKLLSGQEVVDKIASVRRDRGNRPMKAQTIERAVVYRAP